jgi:hypothetical protein
MRPALLLASLLALAGCMSPNDPDARTHCLIPSMCLDIAANHGNGPGFRGTAAAISAATANIPQAPAPILPTPTYGPQNQVHIAPFTCNRAGNFVHCD